MRIDSESPTLPELTRVEALRDAAARTESAAAERAAALAEDAVSCPQCEQVLSLVAANSRSREEALGGVWSPWGDSAPEGAEQVPPVADAPVSVEEFASWLASTARRDLAAAADPSRLEPANARALASAALGRYRSALDLAGVFEVDLDSHNAEVADLNARLRSIVGSRPVDVLGTWGLDPQALSTGSALPEPELPAAGGLAESAELAEAIASWDCTAQSLPKAQLIAESIDDAEARAHELFSRVDRYLAAGAVDSRTLRCTVDALDAASLATGLLAADLHLLASDDETMRLIGVHAALEDLEAWPTGEEGASPALIGSGD